jgi:nitrate/nitrite transporter NarK
MAGTAVTVQPENRIAGRRRALSLLAVAMLLGMTTWFSASAVVPQLRLRWSLSTTAVVWLTIAVQLGFVAGALVSAVLSLADVFSPRRVIAASCLAAAIANGLLLIADGPAAGIPLRFATGFFLAGVYPPGLKVISSWYRSEGRGTALGILVGALTLGSAVPHLVNGLGGVPWEAVVGATSALTLLGGLMSVALVRDGPFPFPPARFDPRQAGRVFANRGVRLASLGYFGHMWELYAMWAWFLVFFSESVVAAGGSAATAPLATFAVIGSGAVGCYLGGVLGDRWGRSWTTVAAMALSGTSAATIGWLFGARPWVVLAVGLVWGVTVVADSAQFSTVVTEVADQSYVGTALTLQLAVGFTLTVATIWRVPLIRDAVGWGWAFALLALGPAGGILAMLRLRASPAAARIAGGRG